MKLGTNSRPFPALAHLLLRDRLRECDRLRDRDRLREDDREPRELYAELRDDREREWLLLRERLREYELDR